MDGKRRFAKIRDLQQPCLRAVSVPRKLFVKVIDGRRCVFELHAHPPSVCADSGVGGDVCVKAQ